MRGQPGIGAGVKKQRGQAGLRGEALDAADENEVVAARVDGLVPAFEPGATPFEQRGSGQAAARFDASKRSVRREAKRLERVC